MDIIWSREPSTISKNMGHVKTLISTCESSGFSPELPALGPYPLNDKLGIAVAFSMILQSWKPGRHSKSHTQFATIRKQRSAFSNLYNSSAEAASTNQILAVGVRLQEESLPAPLTPCGSPDGQPVAKLEWVLY